MPHRHPGTVPDERLGRCDARETRAGHACTSTNEPRALIAVRTPAHDPCSGADKGRVEERTLSRFATPDECAQSAAYDALTRRSARSELCRPLVSSRHVQLAAPPTAESKPERAKRKSHYRRPGLARSSARSAMNV